MRHFHLPQSGYAIVTVEDVERTRPGDPFWTPREHGPDILPWAGPQAPPLTAPEDADGDVGPQATRSE